MQNTTMNESPRFRFTIPLPPSVNASSGFTANNAGAKKGIVFTSHEVIKWRDDVGKQLKDVLPAMQKQRIVIPDAIFLVVTLYKSDRRAWDVDNRLKKLQDKFSGVLYSDDTQIEFVFPRKEQCEKGQDRCVVSVFRVKDCPNLYAAFRELHRACMED